MLWVRVGVGFLLTKGWGSAVARGLKFGVSFMSQVIWFQSTVCQCVVAPCSLSNQG